MGEWSGPILMPIIRNRPDPDYTIREICDNNWGLEMCAEAFAVADVLGIEIKLAEDMCDTTEVR